MVENLFVKKSFTRFALQSEWCNFNQWEHWIYQVMWFITRLILTNSNWKPPYTHTKCFAQKRLVCFTGLRKWTLVASISKNKHCSCTMKIPTSYKFQRMALSRTFKYASPSLFLRRPVFTLILFGVVVCDGFHLDLLGFPFVYQFNSRIGVLVRVSEFLTFSSIVASTNTCYYSENQIFYSLQ